MALSSPNTSSPEAEVNESQNQNNLIASSKEDFSLPSSFSPSMSGGSNKNVMVIQGNSQDSVTSVNSEQQLAMRIDKETKPHHHLLRLLKELDMDSEESSDPTKGEAVASLVSDFEKEVLQIERKIHNEKMLTNTAENTELPPGWIALECPDTLEIYYANEETGDVSGCFVWICVMSVVAMSLNHLVMHTYADNLGSSRARIAAQWIINTKRKFTKQY